MQAPNVTTIPRITSCVSQGRVSNTTEQCCSGLSKVKTASNPDVFMCVKPTTATCLKK
jgi:hypothetical protein